MGPPDCSSEDQGFAGADFMRESLLRQPPHVPMCSSKPHLEFSSQGPDADVVCYRNRNSLYVNSLELRSSEIGAAFSLKLLSRFSGPALCSHGIISWP